MSSLIVNHGSVKELEEEEFKTNCYVLDCEFLVDKYGKFKPKEVAVIHFERPLFLHHFMLHTPECGMNDHRNKFFVQNMFNYSINRGKDEMKDVMAKIKPYHYVYVQGEEKRQLIQSYLPFNPIINVEAPSLTKMTDPYKHICCPIGMHSETHCSTKKLYRLYNYILTNYNITIE